MESSVFDQLARVRALRLRGLDGPSIARQAGIPKRRVKFLEQYYEGRPLVRFLTWGLCLQVRQDWALGQLTPPELAGRHWLTLDQVKAVLARAPGTHGEAPYTDPPKRRGRPGKGEAAHA